MEKTWKRVVVAVGDIITGVFTLSMAVYAIMVNVSVGQPAPAMRSMLLVLILLFTVLGLLAVGGGVSAWLRRWPWLVLAGSLSASLSLPIGIPGAILAIFSPKIKLRTRIVILVVMAPFWIVALAAYVLLLGGYR